ncbi:MAG: Reverse transcriptase-like [Haloplasmataceae bacterium]|jgi:ribonuclease HI|nr:Reverse transcriptase-like [Haloplasmataceae bacterium]
MPTKAEVKQYVLERDNHRCSFCGKETKSITQIIPKCLGGRIIANNCFAVCQQCANMHSIRLQDTFKTEINNKTNRATLYTDASVRKAKHKRTKLAFIIRSNNSNKIVEKQSIKLPYHKDTTLMELKSIYLGIDRLINLGIKTAIVYSDNSAALGLITGTIVQHSKRSNNYNKILNEIVLMRKNISLKFKWIKREQNREAHYLTTNAME